MATATPWTRFTPEISPADSSAAAPQLPLYDYYSTGNQRPLYADQAYQQQQQQQFTGYKPHGSSSIYGSDLHSGAASFAVEADTRHSQPAAAGPYHDPSSHAGSSSRPGQHQQQQHHDSMLEQWLVPDTHIRYWALWTSAVTLGMAFIFAWMAGQWSLYQLSPTYRQYSSGGGSGNSTSAMVPLTDTWGPAGLQGWLRFWVSSPDYSFDVPYLLAYGARYMPAIQAGEWWRLFSSICIHGNFPHLFSNALTFVILAVPLEHSYGLLRIGLIFIASGFGGTFLSMAWEDPCMLYVGASGAVFGFLGLYLADLVLNWESMHKPLLRLALMLASLGLTFGVSFATSGRPGGVQRISHLSHVGGLVSGLFVSWLFLPNLRDKRWKAARAFAHSLQERWSHAGAAPPAAAAGRASVMERTQSCWRRHAWAYWLVWGLCAVVTLFFFVALPLYIWLLRMPGLQCPPLMPTR